MPDGLSPADGLNDALEFGSSRFRSVGRWRRRVADGCSVGAVTGR